MPSAVALVGFVVGVAGLAASAVLLARPRRVLRARSPGRIEPGSIPGWRVFVWRGVGVAIAVLSGALVWVAAL